MQQWYNHDSNAEEDEDDDHDYEHEHEEQLEIGRQNAMNEYFGMYGTDDYGRCDDTGDEQDNYEW